MDIFVKRLSGHPRRAFGGLCHCAKFGWNRCSSFNDVHDFTSFDFLTFKCRIQYPTWDLVLAQMSLEEAR